MRKIIIYSLILICLMSFGCKKQVIKKVDEAKPVQVLLASLQPFSSKRTVTGIAEPIKDVVLSAQTNGKVTWFPGKVGQPVSKGQVLVRFEQAVAKASKKSAEAGFDYAKTDYESKNNLYKKQLISDHEWRLAKQQYEIAKSNLEIAKNQYDNTKIAGPFDGSIAERYLDEDEFVSVGRAVVRVVDIHQIKVKIGVTGEDVQALSLNSKVDLYFSSLPLKRYVGTISSIGEASDSLSKTFPVEIIINNSDRRIKAGMLCDVTFVHKKLNQVVVVPQSTIIEGEFKSIFVAMGQKAKQLKVNVLAMQGSMVAISGVDPNLAVIVNGHKELVDNQSIKIIKDQS